MKIDDPYEWSAEGQALQHIKSALADACRTLRVISTELTAVNDHFREQCIDLQLESDWRFAAMVVDRFCLYLFSIFILVSSVTLVLPQFFNEAQSQTV